MRQHILDNPISYYVILLSARYLPTKLCHWLGKLVALVAYSFSHKDRAGLAFNLSKALNRPMDDSVIRKTIRRIFINYGEYMVDYFLMPQLPPHKARKFFAYLEGEEILQNALPDKTR